MKAFKIVSIISFATASLLYANSVTITTPSQFDENSTYITTAEDNNGIFYKIFQNGSDPYDLDRAQLIKYNGSSWDIMTSSWADASSDDQTHYISQLEFKQNDMLFDSNNKLHIAYVEYDSEFDESYIAYQRYNPNSNDYNGWESSGGFFKNGLDADYGQTIPDLIDATDLSLDINGSNTPIISYIDSSSNIIVRYLNENDTVGSDNDSTNFNDDTWDTLGTLAKTALELDMIIDNDIPYIAYIDTNSKLAVVKYENNSWSIVDDNITNANASTLELTKESDGNIYMSFLDTTANPNVKRYSKLRRYEDKSISENNTSTIAQVISDLTNKEYILEGEDNASFTITSDGNLSFLSGANYEDANDSNHDNLYKVDVIVKDNDTNLTAQKNFNITIENINEAPIVESTAVISGAKDTLYSYELNASDEDAGTTLTWSVTDGTTLLSWLTLDNNGTLYGTPTAINGAVPSNDINLTLSDGKNNVTHNFTLNISGLNDAPVITQGSESNITISEDNSPTAFSLTLNAIDTESDTITWSIESNASNGIASVSNSPTGTSQAINYTPNTNYNGSDSFVVKVSDDTGSSTITVNVTVNAVDDAPTFTTTQTNITGIQEDGTVDLINLPSVTDTENDTITYTVVSSDTSIATVSIVDGKVIVTPVENANGIVTVEVNATANGQSTLQDFNVTIDAVNDTPTFITSLSDITINEDNGTTNYELNVTDIEGDELNITVESNDTTILNVSLNWSGLLTQGQYDGLPLDFNLTTQNNANGIVSITIKINDENNASVIDSFDINVSAINDIPVLSSVSNIYVYKDSQTKSIILDTSDIDSDTLDYNAIYTNSELVSDISFVENNMTVTITDALSGKSDINVTISDGELSTSESFIFNVLALKEDDSIKENGEVEVDENETITITFDDSKTVKAQTQPDSNGIVSHEIDLGDKKVVAISDLNGTIVELTDNGVHTKYEDQTANLIVEVNATITGQSTHTLDINGTKTVAVSNIVGAITNIKDLNGSIQIETTVTNDNNVSFKVVAKQNGEAFHTVELSNGKVSKATSKVSGTQTTVKLDNSIETKAKSGNTIATVVTKEDGTNTIEFTDGNITINPLPTNSSFEADSSVTIEDVNGSLQMTVESPLTQVLQF